MRPPRRRRVGLGPELGEAGDEPARSQVEERRARHGLPGRGERDEGGRPGGVAVLDSRTFVYYYHSTSDGRIMLGKGGNTFAYDTTAGGNGLQSMPCSGNVGLGPYSAIILSQ